MSPPLRLSAFAADKGKRLGHVVREQLHPLISDSGVVAVQVIYLYEADGQMLGGSLELATQPGAADFLERIARARYAGALPNAVTIETVHPAHKKS